MANIPGRIDRICNMLRAVMDDGFITRNRASEIQGHLNFAAGFYISKALQFLVSAFGRLADIPRALVAEDLKLLCNLAISMITSLPSRQFKTGSMRELLSTTRVATVLAVLRMKSRRSWSNFGFQKRVNRSFLKLKCSPSFV